MICKKPLFPLVLLLALGSSPLRSADPSVMLSAGEEQQIRDERVAQATLLQVQYVARNTKTLEELGKQTLQQASTMLDLGTAGIPVLTQWMKNRKKDWRVRYWAADMCGYVGNPALVRTLLRLAANEKEKQLLRLRALDSVIEIARRGETHLGLLKAELDRTLRRIKSREVREKVVWAVKEAEGLSAKR